MFSPSRSLFFCFFLSFVYSDVSFSCRACARRVRNCNVNGVLSSSLRPHVCHRHGPGQLLLVHRTQEAVNIVRASPRLDARNSVNTEARICKNWRQRVRQHCCLKQVCSKSGRARKHQALLHYCCTSACGRIRCTLGVLPASRAQDVMHSLGHGRVQHVQGTPKHVAEHMQTGTHASQDASVERGRFHVLTGRPHLELRCSHNVWPRSTCSRDLWFVK